MNSEATSELTRSIEMIPVPVIISHAHTRTVVAVNTAACDQFRMQRGDMVGHRVDDLTHPEFHAELAANFSRSRDRDGFTTLKRYVRGDGTSFMGQLHAAPCSGHPDLLTAVVTSIKDADRLRSEVVAAATVDELTSALRRAAFLKAAHLEASMHPHFGLVFLDVDGMKQVNDTLGHDAGDALLIAVADRVRSAFRQGDLVGRFGGDEFVMFIGNVPNAAELGRVTAALERRVALPLVTDAGTIDVQVSIGAVFCTNDVALERAISAADELMYAAKERRRGDRSAGDATEVAVLDE